MCSPISFVVCVNQPLSFLCLIFVCVDKRLLLLTTEMVCFYPKKGYFRNSTIVTWAICAYLFYFFRREPFQSKIRFFPIIYHVKRDNLKLFAWSAVHTSIELYWKACQLLAENFWSNVSRLLYAVSLHDDGAYRSPQFSTLLITIKFAAISPKPWTTIHSHILTR